MNLDNTIAIKIDAGSIPAKACMALKNLTGLSLCDIKTRIANDDFLYVCDYLDDDGLKLANKIKREMKKFESHPSSSTTSSSFMRRLTGTIASSI